jgi:hypothetical protein
LNGPGLVQFAVPVAGGCFDLYLAANKRTGNLQAEFSNLGVSLFPPGDAVTSPLTTKGSASAGTPGPSLRWLLNSTHVVSSWSSSQVAIVDGAETTAISPCQSHHKLVLAASVEPRRILLLADNQFRRTTFRRVLRTARGLQPHLVLHVGDAVGNGEKAKEWRFDWWGPLAELGLPVLMARGNHDAEGPLAHALTDLPYEMERDSRSYTLAGVHFGVVRYC